MGEQYCRDCAHWYERRPVFSASATISYVGCVIGCWRFELSKPVECEHWMPTYAALYQEHQQRRGAEGSENDDD